MNHIVNYFASHYAEEDWARPHLDNRILEDIGTQGAQWLKRTFEEEEVRWAVIDLAGDKARGPDGFPLAFFQRFWGMLKKNILAFMEEFHQSGKLFKGTGASFISFVPKKSGELGIKDLFFNVNLV